jgi:hypothetical protein
MKTIRLAVGLILSLAWNSLTHAQSPVVTVHATDAQSREPGLLAVVDSAQFAIRRDVAAHDSLTVFFTLGGTAGNGGDYVFITNQVTIPAGATQALVHVAPRLDNLIEPTETVELLILAPLCAAVFPPPPGCYVTGFPASATVFIQDSPVSTNPPPVITLESPTNGAVFTAGANIGIRASAGNAEGTLARIDFLVNGQVIGSFPDPFNFYSVTFLHWTNVPAGAYAVAARVWDDENLSQLSSVAHITVLPAPTNSQGLPGEMTITFNPASLPFGSRSITNWTEGGFHFSTPDRMAHSDGGLSNRPDNGSAYLTFSANQKPLTFRHLAGRTFSLLNLDLAEYSTVFRTPKDITITGYQPDNTAVTTVVRIDGAIDGPGGAADFQTFTFGPEFSQLDRVEIFPDIYSLDNVRVVVEGTPTNSIPPRTVVNVLAVDPVAGEPPHAAGPGKFSIRRSGDLTASLPVFLAISGSASNGTDYALLPEQVVIPAGAAETFLDVTPLFDTHVELNEQVVLTLLPPVCIATVPPPPECYVSGVSTSAVVTIISAPPTNATLPVVSLFSPINGSIFPAGATVLLGANASGASPIQRVEFIRGSTFIGASFGQPATGAGWTLLWSNPPSGSHVLREGNFRACLHRCRQQLRATHDSGGLSLRQRRRSGGNRPAPASESRAVHLPALRPDQRRTANLFPNPRLRLQHAGLPAHLQLRGHPPGSIERVRGNRADRRRRAGTNGTGHAESTLLDGLSDRLTLLGDRSNRRQRFSLAHQSSSVPTARRASAGQQRHGDQRLPADSGRRRPGRVRHRVFD